MSKSTPKLSAKQAAVEVLQEEGKPLPMKTICERVMQKNVALKGKTPHATINAIIVVAANKGETFKRTARGVYGLRSQAKPEPVKKLDEKPKAEDAIEADLARGTAKARGKAEVKPDPKPKSEKKGRGRAKATA